MATFQDEITIKSDPWNEVTTDLEIPVTVESPRTTYRDILSRMFWETEAGRLADRPMPDLFAKLWLGR